jgi:hypothetical protein
MRSWRRDTRRDTQLHLLHENVKRLADGPFVDTAALGKGKQRQVRIVDVNMALLNVTMQAFCELWTERKDSALAATPLAA